jgi:outer membrane immunogenic protein
VNAGAYLVKWVLGSVAVIAMLTGAASAADMPAKAPLYKAPPPPLVTTWTGFYIGGNFGYGVGRVRSVALSDDQQGFIS